MSHEKSETVKDENTGKWVNVYGRDTPKAGARLPKDITGYGHREYETVDAAVDEAKRRSKLQPPHKDAPEPQAYVNGGLVRDYAK